MTGWVVFARTLSCSDTGVPLAALVEYQPAYKKDVSAHLRFVWADLFMFTAASAALTYFSRQCLAKCRILEYAFCLSQLCRVIATAVATPEHEEVSARVKVFYGFGAAGLLWSSWWESVVSSMAKDDPEAHRLLTETAATREASRSEPEQAMPWRAFLRNGPMRALAYTHFCNNWCALPARPSIPPLIESFAPAACGRCCWPCLRPRMAEVCGFLRMAGTPSAQPKASPTYGRCCQL